MKIIIRNRRNYEDKQELTISEFKIKFSKELTSALQIYTNNRKQKDMIKPLFMNINTDYKSEFYSDLRWNFNTNSNSKWYIDRIK